MSRPRRAARAGVATAVIGLAAYDAGLAAFGWRTPKPPPPGNRRRRFRVVMPAHNEAHVLPHLLSDLAAQNYPRECVRLVVLADRCRDGTAAVAAAAGVEVAERAAGPPGKGPALAWLLEQEPLDRDEALVVLDADNRVGASLLAGFADALDAGEDVVQAALDVTNPQASWLATAAAVAYRAGGRMTQAARRNLGWAADLGGTGMCLSAAALASAGGFGASLTEDRELAMRLLLAGHRVGWLHHLRVADEKPTGLAVAVRQRGRWRRGTGQVRREFLLPLLRDAVHRRSATSLDHGLRLVRPTRSTVLLASAGLTLLANYRPGRLSWRGWAALTGVQLGLPLVFLIRDGAPRRYLVGYPLALVYPVLAPAVRVAARCSRGGWVHTPHAGISAPVEGGTAG